MWSLPCSPSSPCSSFKVPQPERRDLQVEAEGKSSVWQDFRAGLRYVWGWPGLMLIGIMATVINFLLTPAFSLLPILVTKHFNGQAIQLATLESFSGIRFHRWRFAPQCLGWFQATYSNQLVGSVCNGSWVAW